MDAKVKKESRYGTITAFSGREYTKTEWRAVPEGLEEEARRNPYLELRGSEKEMPSLDELQGLKPDAEQPTLKEMQGIAEGEPAVEPEPTPEPEPEPAKKPAGKSKRKK